MTTTENNKLIAEFMGFEWFEINEPYIAVREPNGGVKHFQTNWDDLMQVVEKIESLGFFFEIKSNWVRITKKREIIVIRWEQDKNKIEATYNACVEFIKWYNQNKI